MQHLRWLPHPSPAECISFRSHHPGGCHFVLVDGSVHFLSETIDLRTFGHLGARNDGQVLGPW